MTPQTRDWARRGLAVLLLLLGIALGALFLLITTLPAARLGWLWTALVCLALLALPVLVLGPRRPRRWFVAVTVVSLGLGLVLWTISPPSHDRIGAAYDAEISVPEGLEETGREERGNTWCYVSCPTLTVEYAADGTAQEGAERLAAALREDGWERHEERGGSYTKGRWRVIVRAEPRLGLEMSG